MRGMGIILCTLLFILCTATNEKKKEDVKEMLHNLAQSLSKKSTEMDTGVLNKVLDDLKNISSFEDLISFVDDEYIVDQSKSYYPNDWDENDIKKIVRMSQAVVIAEIISKSEKLNKYKMDNLFKLYYENKNFDFNSPPEVGSAFLRSLIDDETFDKLKCKLDGWHDLCNYIQVVISDRIKQVLVQKIVKIGSEPEIKEIKKQLCEDKKDNEALKRKLCEAIQGKEEIEKELCDAIEKQENWETKYCDAMEGKEELEKQLYDEAQKQKVLQKEKEESERKLREEMTYKGKEFEKQICDEKKHKEEIKRKLNEKTKETEEWKEIYLYEKEKEMIELERERGEIIMKKGEMEKGFLNETETDEMWIEQLYDETKENKYLNRLILDNSTKENKLSTKDKLKEYKLMQ